MNTRTAQGPANAELDYKMMVSARQVEEGRGRVP